MAETLAEIHKHLESSVGVPGKPTEPLEWVLRLTQLALVQDAKQVTIQADSGFWWVVLWPLGNLAALYRDYLEEKGDPILRLAIQAAQPFMGSLKLFFQISPEESHTIEIAAAGEHAEPGKVLPPCLVIRAQFLPQVKPNLDFLRERLRFSPMPVLLRQTMVNRPLLHQNMYFSKDVHADQEASLRRNFVERIWLSDGPLANLMMISDPLEQSAQRRGWQGLIYTGAP